jgi:hypothetical protein
LPRFSLENRRRGKGENHIGIRNHYWSIRIDETRAARAIGILYVASAKKSLLGEQTG